MSSFDSSTSDRSSSEALLSLSAQPEWNLAWPVALGGCVGTAIFKQEFEDFQVTEQIPFAPAGQGEHLFLQIEKTGQNTSWLARQFAKMAEIPAADVSYAGLKDRQGVTVQWFSLRIPGLPAANEHELWQQRLAAMEGVKLLSSSRHDRKLRIGALEGNHFVIRLRAFDGDKAVLDQRLDQIGSTGVPNYFGEQRFGNGGHNLILAYKLFSGAIKLAREKRGFALSSSRSYIFNQVLAERVKANTWNVLTEGDVLTFPNAASLIFPQRRDATVESRFQDGVLLNTGPLWGKGELVSEGAVAALESGAAEDNELFAKGLEGKGLKQERRALVSQVKDLSWEWHGDDLELRFFLYKGCYATAVIHELVECRVSESGK